MITLEHYMNRQLANIYLIRYDEVEPSKIASYFDNGYRQYAPTQGNTFNFILSNEMDNEKQKNLSLFLLNALKKKKVANICIVFPSSIGENVLQFLKDFFYRLFYTEKNKILENSQTPPPESEGNTPTDGEEISADSTKTNPANLIDVGEVPVDLTEAEKRALLPNAAGRDKEAIQAICNSVLNINTLEVNDMSELIKQLQSTLDGISSADNGIDGCFVYTSKETYMNKAGGGSGVTFTKTQVSDWIGFFASKSFRDKYGLISEGVGNLQKIILSSDKAYTFLYFVDNIIIGFLSSREDDDDFGRADDHSEKALLGDEKNSVSTYSPPNKGKPREKYDCLKKLLTDAGIL
jgi:hypothetical protein